MDILETTDDSSAPKVLVVKDDYLDPIIRRNKGKTKSVKKAAKTSLESILVDDDQEIKYEVEEDGSGVAVAYRVVELSPDLTTSPSTSPTIYNTINRGLCVLPQIEVYPVSQRRKQIVPSRNCSEDSKAAFPSRDDRRRATHNEVERRRRDKINNWILKLSKIIPECKNEPRKGGSFESQSKGYILAKACDYITELKGINEQLAFALKQQEHLSNDVEAMSRKLKDISQENDILKATLAQHGISLP